MKKAPVEKFRLTKDQLAFQKAYKERLRIAKFLRSRAAENMAQGAQINELYRQTTGEMEQLILQAPKNTVNELPGQEPAEEMSAY